MLYPFNKVIRGIKDFINNEEVWNNMTVDQKVTIAELLESGASYTEVILKEDCTPEAMEIKSICQWIVRHYGASDDPAWTEKQRARLLDRVAEYYEAFPT